MTGQTFRGARWLAALGVLLACSCWITAPAMFGVTMGENFSEDPAEQARIAAYKEFWAPVLFCSWLIGLTGSSTIAGFTLRSNRILALITLLIVLAFVVFAVLWMF